VIDAYTQEREGWRGFVVEGKDQGDEAQEVMSQCLDLLNPLFSCKKYSLAHKYIDHQIEGQLYEVCGRRSNEEVKEEKKHPNDIQQEQ